MKVSKNCIEFYLSILIIYYLNVIFTLDHVHWKRTIDLINYPVTEEISRVAILFMNCLVHSNGAKITNPFYINNPVSYELTFVQVIKRNIEFL